MKTSLRLAFAAFAALAGAAAFPAAAFAQTVSDASVASDAGDIVDAAPEATPDAAPDASGPLVLPSPDAAVASGCDGQMLNAPCTLGGGTSGFCFPNGVDGSDEDLECVVDSDVDPDTGCRIARDVSSASTVGTLAVLVGLVFASLGRTRRRGKRSGPRRK